MGEMPSPNSALHPDSRDIYLRFKTYDGCEGNQAKVLRHVRHGGPSIEPGGPRLYLAKI